MRFKSSGPIRVFVAIITLSCILWAEPMALNLILTKINGLKSVANISTEPMALKFHLLKSSINGYAKSTSTAIKCLILFATNARIKDAV